MTHAHYRLLAIGVLLLLPFGLGGTCNETLTDDDDTEGQDSQHPSHDPNTDPTGDKDIP